MTRVVGATRQIMPQVVLSLLAFWMLAALFAGGVGMGEVFGCMVLVYQKTALIGR